MKYNLKYLEKLHDIIEHNDCFLKKTKKVSRGKKTKGYTFQYYNQFCACIIRIRETTNYLEQFKFKKDNNCSQAFDFYEFINCLSIIEGCIESFFKIFDLDVSKYYDKKSIFKVSNMTKTNDLAFFKFIRSASSMHPSETTSHNKITKHKFEVYPYAIWINSNSTIDFEDRPKDADIEMLSWNCKTNGNYKRYYLKSIEFEKFLNDLLLKIKILIPVAQNIADEYKELIRCKILKTINDFNDWKEYCLYLRKRIKSKLDNGIEFPDGGLLLASHILVNPLIGNAFKNYIKRRVIKISKKMLKDITLVEYDEIFNELSLYKMIGKFDHGGYASEKFHNYLYKETIHEIENNDFITFKDKLRLEVDNLKYTDAEWSVLQLIQFRNCIYFNNELQKANSYADLYEMTLEIIYNYNKIKL